MCWYVGVSNRWSLARQLLLVQVVLVAVLVGGGVTLAYVDAERATEDRATEEVTTVAVTVADSPSVRTAVLGPDPSAELQPFAERVRADTGVDFITIMDTGGIRYTHPNPALIGQPFVGNTAAALRGETFTETYTGTLGPSMRVVVPVEAEPGRVIALVSVGITVSALSAELRERVLTVLAVAGLVLAVGFAASLLVSARLKRQTRGVAPAELSAMFDYHEAVLHAVREGLVLIDSRGKIALINDGARTLLGLPPDVQGTPVAEAGLPEELTAALLSGEPRADEIHVTETGVLLLSAQPVRSRERSLGSVVTLRDHTQLQTLTGELDTVRSFAESLRSQAHESANRLHTVVSLVEMGEPEEAVRFATAELEIAQQLTDQVVGAVSEPVIAALLLGKAAEASERGAELVLTPDTAMDSGTGGLDTRDLVTILGNLVDNAIDAAIAGASQGRPTVSVTVRQEHGELLLRVADTGPGVDPDSAEQVFRRGWTSKPAEGPAGRGLGLALVGQAVRRHGGTIGISRDVGAVFTVRLPVRGRG